MAHIFITRAVPGAAPDLLREAGHEVVTWPGELPPSRAELIAALADADAAMTMVTDRVDGEVLKAAPRLRIAANMAVGYDNLVVPDGNAAGVWFTNTPGILHQTTAELAIALMLAATRRVVESERDTRAGGWKTWSPTAFLGLDLHSATVGVVGLGEIGTAVATILRLGFGAKVVYHSRTRKPDLEAAIGVRWAADLGALLSEADIVTIHVPRTPETAAMMGKAEFAAMKAGSIFVNTARGNVIDQDALVEAVRSGHLRGAALDVTDPEPLPMGHPFYSMDNVIVTPHIASASTLTRSKMAELAARNIIAVLNGQPPITPVNEPATPRS